MCILNKKQAAELLHISQRTMDYWRVNFGLPTVKIGQTCRFFPEDILNWFSKFRKENTNGTKAVENSIEPQNTYAERNSNVQLQTK